MLELRCPRCNAPQTLAEAPAAGEAVRIACITCGAVFRVRGRSKTASALIDGRAPPPLPDEGSPVDEGERSKDGAPRWQVRKKDGTALQFPNLRVFQRWVVDGVVSLDDAISRNGRTWRPITAIPELVGLFERVEALKNATGAPDAPPPVRAAVTSSAPPELPPPELPPPELPPPELPPPELPPDTPEPPPAAAPPASNAASDAPEADEPVGSADSGIDSTLQDISLAEIRAGLAMDFGDFKASRSSAEVPSPEPAPEPAPDPAPPAPAPSAPPEALGPSTSELSDYLASAYGDTAPSEPSPPAPRSEVQPELGPWTAGDDLVPAGSASDIQKLRESPPDESELIGSTLQMRLPDMRVARTATPVPFSEPDAVIASVPPPPKRLWLLLVTLLALGGAGFATWWFVIRESPSQAEPAPAATSHAVAHAPATAPAPSKSAPPPKVEGHVEPPPAEPAPEPKVAAEGQRDEIETRRGALSAIDTAMPVVAKAEPKAVEPKAAEPKATEPKAAEPKVAEPKVAEPKVAEPKVVEPKVAEPKVAEPKTPPTEGVDPYDTAISEASAAQKSGNLAGALAALERAASLNPKTVEPIAKMGWIHLSMGNASQAIVRFQEAKRRNPGYRDTYLGLAKAYEADGRRDEAIDVYRNYLRLCATSKCRQADAVKAALTRLGAGP